MSEPRDGADAPLVAVVMPVRNVRTVVDDQLAALAAQDFSGPWELIVADNGSTDGTREHVEGWRERLPMLTVIDASAVTGAGPARNVGVSHTRARLIAFCDGDDVVDEAWLSSLVVMSVGENVVAGHYYESEEAVDSARSATAPRLPASSVLHCDFRPIAATCNMLVTRRAFDQVGGFDPYFRFHHDAELSWRLQDAGFTIHAAPAAVVRKRPQVGWRGWRQRFRWARYEAALHRRYRTLGMPTPPLRRAAAAWAFVVFGAPLALLPRWRTQWLRRSADRLGRLVGSVKERTVYL